MTSGDTAHPPASAWQAHDLAVLGRLRRFATGRAQGLPGFAVLAGPVAHGVALWRAWQAERGAVAILTGHAGREAAIRACLDGMLAGRDVVADIAALLAPALAHARGGRVDAVELAGRLVRQGLPERMALLRSLEHAPGLDPRLLGVCQSLLADPSGAGLTAEAGTVALVAALRPGALPGLLLVEPALQHDAAPAPQVAGSAWLAQAAATALHLGEVAPGLLVGLAAERARIEAFLASGPAAQVAARVRAGLVVVSAPAQAARPDERTGSLEQGPDLERAAWVRRSLEQERVAPAVLAAFDETVRLLAQASASTGASGPKDAPAGVSAGAPAGALDDVLARARSQAERTLYEYLAGHAQTAGLFELNGRMPFDFGNRQAEVDLVCRQLGLAVEIDGYYHFRDQDGFRRDRRKDVLLQSHGFLVMRFLAGDVAARLAEITTQILDAVRLQRQRLGRHQP
jgi:very-short-patch-repair endonuclease